MRLRYLFFLIAFSLLIVVNHTNGQSVDSLTTTVALMSDSLTINDADSIIYSSMDSLNAVNKSNEASKSSTSSENPQDSLSAASSKGLITGELKVNQNVAFTIPDHSIPGGDSIAATYYTIFEEMMKEKKFKLAYYPWKSAIAVCPFVKIDLYKYGASLLDSLHIKASTAEEKKRYENELLYLYDRWYHNIDSINTKVIEPISKTGLLSREIENYVNMVMDTSSLNTQKKAIYIKDNLSDSSFDSLAYVITNLFIKSLRENDNKADISLSFFDTPIAICSSYFKQGRLNYDTFKQTYEACKEIYNILTDSTENNTKKEEALETLSSNIDISFYSPYMKNYIKENGLSKSDEEIEVLDLEFYSHINDERWIKNTINALVMNKDCDLYYSLLESYLQLPDLPQRAKENEKFRKDLENNYFIPLINHDISKERDDGPQYDEYFRHYKFWNDNYTFSNSDKSINYFTMARKKNELGDIKNARTLYRNAIALNNEYGDAYIGLAVLYANNNSQWSDDPVLNQCTFFVVLDKLQTAKRVDPSVAEEADRLIKIYSNYTPKIEDLFMISIKKGDKVEVKGWINETTTVR